MRKIALVLFVALSMMQASFALDLSSQNRQIRTLLNKHNKALSNHDIKTVEQFYDKDYKSSDGFSLEELSQMLEKTYKTYSNLKYKTKINKIVIFDNYAVAEVSDETSATLYSDEDKKDENKAGYLKGKSAYVVYLKKDDNEWKIFYDDILMEETSLKYGIANKIDMEFKVPVFIQNGQEYDLSLKMNKPDDIIALGSISNEEITYPQGDYEEKFRKIPSEGALERIVKANRKNLDEYAIASVGFTKVSVNEQETKARIEVMGMAYIMKRINMIEDKKEATKKL